MDFWGKEVRYFVNMLYEDRIYRSLINIDNLISSQIKIDESDLLISSDINLDKIAFQSLTFHRHSLQSYINVRPQFKTSLLPISDDDFAPPIVRDMIAKAKICGVGPMSSVAGAVSEFVGKDLLPHTDNLIIENGGDIYMKSNKNRTVSIFAGESALSYKVNLMIKAEDTPIGICTSSATVGPSLSFGIADAVCVLSKSATLSDAAASAIGNRVKNKSDIKNALAYGNKISGVDGIVIILGNNFGAIGNIKFA